MLRITVQENTDPITLRLEGKLVGDWVPELRAVWAVLQPGLQVKNVAVSLTCVCCVDDAGRRLLTEIHSTGGQLTGSGLFVRTLIEEITRKPVMT